MYRWYLEVLSNKCIASLAWPCPVPVLPLSPPRIDLADGHDSVEEPRQSLRKIAMIYSSVQTVPELIAELGEHMLDRLDGDWLPAM
jgi:hypothetical protein